MMPCFVMLLHPLYHVIFAFPHIGNTIPKMFESFEIFFTSEVNNYGSCTSFVVAIYKH